MTAELRFDQIQFKASHNSYAKSADLSTQLSWDEDSPHEYGLLGLELDLVQAPGERDFRWRVKHGGSFEAAAGDAPAPDFRELLENLRDASNGEHPPVTVFLDLKNAPGEHAGFADALDAEILNVLRDQVLMPSAVIGALPDLVRGARAGGWPRLTELKGYFVFCLSGNRGRKRAYVRTDPKARVCFADFYVDPDLPPRIPRKGHRVFMNFPVHDAEWKQAVPDFVKRRGFITRGFTFHSAEEFERGREIGVNILSVDRLVGQPAFHLGGEQLRAIPQRA